MSAAKEDSLEPTGSKSKDVQKKSSKNRPLEAKNRTSLPAGLALMHGFSAKNVGKQRITVNSTLNAMGGVCLIIDSNLLLLWAYSTKGVPLGNRV